MCASESTIPATPAVSWVEFVRQIPDPRAKRGRRYAWTTVLTLICAALVSGMSTGAAMGQ